MPDYTELQEDIIAEHKKDESKSDEEIAAKLDCSASYVNETRNEYSEDGSSGISTGLLVVVALLLLLLFIGSDGGSATQIGMLVF